MLVTKFFKKLRKKNLIDEYSSVAKEVNWSVPFLYFPLHFQPERTTSPLGGVYCGQILLIETLAASLPAGWEVVVKEHPSQWWMRTKEQYSSARYPGYYKRIASIPHVRVVPVKTETFDLIDKSRAIAVITGTAGWEALLKGKCPLVFGLPWYRDCPGIFKVNSVDSCKKALQEIINGVTCSSKELLAFMIAFDRSSIPAILDNIMSDMTGGKPRHTPDENMRIVAKTVCAELTKIQTT